MRNATSILLLAAWMFIASAGPAGAQAAPAAEADVAFFVGRWATGPAPVEGYDTIALDAPACERPVEIIAAGQGLIRRLPSASAAPQDGPTFKVMHIAGRFAWWPTDGGGGPVARRAGPDAFDLAPTHVGQADWGRAIRHRRCPATPDSSPGT
ncbi:hypothetical protein [Phenylobacterium sp.]|uniref:hypothetical protein n=1 Tax=Phenylobacterium sp. TaxID=1871053 RepID=UPI0028974F4F|nr:hypothetical protein [Phenylobacterium sp.]